MTRVSFTVPGRIGGWQRAGRDTRRGPSFSFTPKKMRSDQGIVKHFANAAMVKGRCGLLRGPLLLEVFIWRAYPKSWSAKQCGVTDYITGKPDFDNLQKTLADSMNGIVYLDDSQIACSVFTRKYREGGPEQVDVAVAELCENFPPVRNRARKHLLEA